MDQSLGQVQTQTRLIDLNNVLIATLRGCEAAELAESLDWVLAQVNRPRGNISESGPPGRVD